MVYRLPEDAELIKKRVEEALTKDPLKEMGIDKKSARKLRETLDFHYDVIMGEHEIANILAGRVPNEPVNEPWHHRREMIMAALKNDPRVVTEHANHMAQKQRAMKLPEDISFIEHYEKIARHPDMFIASVHAIRDARKPSPRVHRK